MVIEREAIGGQAGTSAMIRNYPGFAQGVSGTRLAFEAYTPGLVFRYHLPCSCASSTGLAREDGHYRLHLSDGGTLVRGR